MARRRDSFFGDLIELGAKLPWWVSMSLALVTFLVFRHFAGAEVELAGSLEGMGAMVRSSLIKTATTFLQYLVPAAFLLGAILAMARQARSNRLLQTVTGAPGLRAVADMDWRQFERLLGAVFRKRGFNVQESAAGADGGVDLRLVKDGELFLVQCKHWRAQKVGVAVMRELYGACGKGGDRFIYSHLLSITLNSPAASTAH